LETKEELARFNEDVKNHFSRNFLFGVLNGIFIQIGLLFCSYQIIIPAFIKEFSSSKILIGLGSILIYLWGIPQLFVAPILQHRRRKSPFYLLFHSLRVFFLALIISLTYFFAEEKSSFFLPVFFLLSIIFWLFSGLGGVPFMEVVGKAIPEKFTAKFFSLRNFWGGGACLLAGYIVRLVFKNYSFPDNYCFLFVLSFVFLALALISFALIREPIYPLTEKRKSWGGYFKSFLLILKKDEKIRFFLFFKWSYALAIMFNPFYVTYAQEILAIKKELLGIFISVQTAGAILANLLWLKLGKRNVGRLILKLSTYCLVLIPLIALTSPILKKFTLEKSWLASTFSIYNFAHLFYLIIYLLWGVSHSGYLVGSNSHLLTISSPEQRASYVGLINTLTALSLLFCPVLGGVLIEFFSYPPAFGASFLIVLFNLLLVRKL
jgi:MFS family permease